MSNDEKRKGPSSIAATLLGLLFSAWIALGFAKRIVSEDTVPGDSINPSLNPSEPDPHAGAVPETQGSASGSRADAETEAHLPRHPNWGTLLVVISLALAFAGGIGFLAVYWTGGNNLLLGGTLALFFGGFGLALVFWSHLLSLHIEVTAPREPLAAPTPDLAPAVDDFRRGERSVLRRWLLKWSAIAGLGTLAAMWVSMLRSFSLSPDSSLYSTIWKRGQRLVTFDGKPVSVDALQPGSTTIVFPEESVGAERAQTVLIRVREDLLRLPGQRANWAPMGNLAYSRVCTHAGCTVGMYEATTHLLMCPCHQSTFNVLDGCQPTGGPAARPLPQLPLYADSQGYLRAAGGFTEPPGPGFWGMP